MPSEAAEETVKTAQETVKVEDATSGTESDSDESMPDLEDQEDGTSNQSQVAAAAGVQEEPVSRSKQSRSEKKARKAMLKLGKCKH